MLRELFNKLTKRGTTPPAEQQLSAIAGISDYLTPMNYRSAESNLPAVVACVEYIVSSLSSLKMNVIKRDDASKEVLYDHPIAELIRDPNPQLNGTSELLSLSMTDLLAFGNSVIVLGSNGDQPTLTPIPWGYVTTPPYRASAETGYRISWGKRDSIAVPRSRIIHLRVGSIDGGWLGRPILGRSQEAVQLARIVESCTKSLFENGLAPTIVLTPIKGRNMNKEDVIKARTSLQKELAGKDNFGKAMFLPSEMTISQVTPNAQHQELLATREWHFTTICALFQVPPQLVGYGRFQTLANFETALKSFAYQPLGRYVKIYSDAFSRILLPDAPDMRVELDHAHLLQSRKEKMEELKILTEMQAITPEEAKKAAGYG